jgi:putative pilus subunit rrgB
MNNNFKRNMTKVAVGVTLLGPAVLGTVTSVFNATSAFADSYQTTNGSVTVKPDNTGQTDGVITLNGANSNQSIKNKQFVFYKVFNATNAKNNESINYTFNEKYKAVVQEVVFNKLSDEYKSTNKIAKASDVSEYVAIDYIQSLNTHKVDGAKAEQQVEGRYSNFRYFVEDLKNAIKSKGIDGDLVKVTSPDENNAIKVKGLSWGYYVVDEVSTGDSIGDGQKTEDATTPDGHKAQSEGTHFASSLVLVNTVNNEATVTLKSDYPEITKKIREDDNQDKIGKNKDGWNDLADFQIGQTVPYSNDIRIPDMNGYHGYYFAIEDRMDQALTFKADKSKIKLTLTKGDKTYTLKDNEYNLQTIGSNVSADVKEAKYADSFEDSKSTFGLEIEDLKAIVDREFANFNSNNENDYSDIKAHVEYEATLNDKAADDTGRPGFENDVRLIFSNDPDSTGTGFNKPTTPPGKNPKGKTPWDTVVAFTYRLNGNKVNTNNLALEGAKFRIYSDEAMTKEVIVKKKESTTKVEETTTTTTTTTQSETTTTSANGDVNTGSISATDSKKSKSLNAYVVVDKDSAANTQGVDIVSDADGNFSIVGLDSGTYYLKEVAAPDGYRTLKDPIKVTITAKMNDDRDHYLKGDGATEKGLQSLSGKADLTEFYHQIFKTGSSDLKADSDAGTLELTVMNETMEKLPVTGGQAMAVVLAVGAGIVGFSIYAVTKKKEEPEA